jgi:acyl-CoA thioesterase I
MSGQPVNRLCFVGDSLTLGIGDPHGQGWVGRILSFAREKGSELTGYNLGIRRDTSVDIAARWKDEVVAKLPQNQRGAIAFAFGTNDCLEEGGTRRVPPSETLAVSARILAEASQVAPVLMIGPPPTADRQENTRISALAADLEALCAKLDVPYFNSFRALIADSVWCDELRAGDGYHPSSGGYAALARRLWSWSAWGELALPQGPADKAA